MQVSKSCSGYLTEFESITLLYALKQYFLVYRQRLDGLVDSVVACDPRGQGFDDHSRVAPTAQWGVTAWADNNCDSYDIAVLGRLFTLRGGA